MAKRPPLKPKLDKGSHSSWEKSADWYNQAVGQKGHYYHSQIILPQALRLLRFSSTSSPSLLDLGCGQGILERNIPPGIEYAGVDVSASLIRSAKQYCKVKNHHFYVADATSPLPIKKRDFTHATILLALQNMAHPLGALKNASLHLASGGVCLLVLNHPCFRIPRQSSWQIDSQKKIQYRRVDRYLTPLEIPLLTHPSKGEKSEKTFSFHYPLSAYFSWLNETGFVVELLEEWVSDKKSEGKAAAMENRSRLEFPLFLTLLARKK